MFFLPKMIDILITVINDTFNKTFMYSIPILITVINENYLFNDVLIYLILVLFVLHNSVLYHHSNHCCVCIGVSGDQGINFMSVWTST